jgi:hypothetical protein
VVSGQKDEKQMLVNSQAFLSLFPRYTDSPFPRFVFLPLILCFLIIQPALLGYSFQASQSQDSSLMKSDNIAYADAMEFARVLNARGINVQSIHRSKLESFFRGIKKAAFFKTDKGVVEVIFFPGPAGAERVGVIERSQAGRYLYSFQGQPEPDPAGDTIDAGRPIYFIAHQNWFVVLDSKDLYGELKFALANG